jgi:uncharacterized protein (TIGR03382 family)
MSGVGLAVAGTRSAMMALMQIIRASTLPLLCLVLVGASPALATNHEPCIPDCQGKACGYNGCGGSCGTCPVTQSCDPTDGQCYASCTPWCDDLDYECGTDGCGNNNGCGTCLPGQQCLQGQCSGSCIPQCTNKSCGPDSCEIGNMCGWCNADMFCVEGQCVTASECVSNCTMVTDTGLANKQCGDDGCGGECGLCLGVYLCDEPNFVCVECGGPGFPCPDPETNPDDPCVPTCTGAVCGPDGCGGSCGVCDFGESCMHGLCMDCTPNCDTAVCGGDGCGGSCGVCDAGFSCIEGSCDPASGVCVPDCGGRTCGSDGCGGLCGQCGAGQACDVDGHCSGAGWSDPEGGGFNPCPDDEVWDDLAQGCVLDVGVTPQEEVQGCAATHPGGPGLLAWLLAAWALTRRRRRA